MIVGHLRRHRTAMAPRAAPLPPAVQAFQEQVAAFNRFLTDLDDVEEETVAIAARFAEMAEAVAFALTADDPASLMQFLVTRPHPDLCTKAGAFRSEEHTSELQSLMRISYAVFCLKKTKN